jgi:hypothetical protein
VLAVPEQLEDGEYRGAYRVERVGRVPVTFSTRKYKLLSGTLVNLSTSGMRMLMLRDLEEGELLVDEEIHVAFSLTASIKINTKVKIRYLHDRVFGAEFRPPLSGPLLDDLARWAFQRREEAAALALARNAGDRPEAEGPAAAELLLVSSSSELGERLAALLPADLPPLRRVAPSIQSIRDLTPSRRVLTLFHVDSPGWETRKRIKTLAESLPAGLPFVLLGTGLDTGQLFELGNELKAAGSYALPENPGSLFARMLQGIFRKHFPGSGAP